jgi:threonine/homoserine/homoserine lactone efflux protein
MTEGRMSGLATGLGAATADALYGTVAALGLTLISGFLLNQRDWLSLVGGGFLIYLGFTTFRANAPTTTVADSSYGVAGSYLSALFLTLTNPMTILFFTAVFAGLGIADAAGDYVSGGLLVLGVFSGSALWWLLLTAGVVLLQTRVENIPLIWINRIAGVVLIVFGIAALYSVIGRF